MKRLVLLVVMCMLMLSACTANDLSDTSNSRAAEASSASEANSASHETSFSKSGDVVEIEEKLFIAQTNDIYINTDDYLGKTLKYEGLFTSYDWEETNSTIYYVIRYGPGCCGYDANAGFEVIWDDGAGGNYPEENSWVEALGVLERYEDNGFEYLRVRLTSLKVLEERGAETVYT